MPAFSRPKNLQKDAQWPRRVTKTNHSLKKVMGYCLHTRSIVESLRRVLLSPSVQPQSVSSFWLTPWVRSVCCQRRNAAFNPNSAIRSATFDSGYRNIARQATVQTGPPRDEAIRAREIQIVGSDGSLGNVTSLRNALNSIDRKLCFIIQVNEKIHPDYAAETPESNAGAWHPRIPVCKVIEKRLFHDSQRAKLKPKKDVAALTKEVELNWNIDPHDLEHRMKRMKDFLEQGRRVEVVFGKKRKGWMRRKEVAAEDAERVLKSVRDSAKEVDGATEWRGMEGQINGGLVMYFQGKKKVQKQEKEVA